MTAQAEESPERKSKMKLPRADWRARLREQGSITTDIYTQYLKQIHFRET